MPSRPSDRQPAGKQKSPPEPQNTIQRISKLRCQNLSARAALFSRWLWFDQRPISLRRASRQALGSWCTIELACMFWGRSASRNVVAIKQ